MYRIILPISMIIANKDPCLKELSRKTDPKIENSRISSIF